MLTKSLINLFANIKLGYVHRINFIKINNNILNIKMLKFLLKEGLLRGFSVVNVDYILVYLNNQTFLRDCFWFRYIKIYATLNLNLIYSLFFKFKFNLLNHKKFETFKSLKYSVVSHKIHILSTVNYGFLLNFEAILTSTGGTVICTLLI